MEPFSGLDGFGVSGRAKKKCVENRFMIIKAQLDQVLAGESCRREKLWPGDATNEGIPYSFIIYGQWWSLEKFLAYQKGWNGAKFTSSCVGLYASCHNICARNLFSLLHWGCEKLIWILHIDISDGHSPKYFPFVFFFFFVFLYKQFVGKVQLLNQQIFSLLKLIEPLKSLLQLTWQQHVSFLLAFTLM